MKEVEITEEQKQAHKKKVRRNFQIIAICVAAYYFFSAGMAYYDESERPKLNENVDVAESISDTQTFKDNFNYYLQLQNVAPVNFNNQQPTADGFEVPLSDSLSMIGIYEKNSSKLEKIQIKVKSAEALPDNALVYLKALIAATENSSEEEYINDLLVKLGIIQSFESDQKDKILEPQKFATNRHIYTVSITGEAFDELTLMAQ